MSQRTGGSGLYGSASFYYRTQGTWELVETIDPGSAISTQFGQSVAVSSNAMVTGAPKADFAGVDSGSIYINNIVKEGCGGGSTTTELPSYFPTSAN